MDFLEKLDFLMEKNNLNKHSLSKVCDIPYTTIDGWYKKGYEGLKLTTLRKLANYFDTTLDFWANDINPTFGERLKEARKKQGLTQEQLAQKIGVAKSTLTGYEKDNREPDLFKIKKILEVLNVDSDYLLGIERNKKPPETENSDSEEEFIERVKLLTSFFENAGYIAPGGDLTAEQFKACKAFVDFLDSYFG